MKLWFEDGNVNVRDAPSHRRTVAPSHRRTGDCFAGGDRFDGQAINSLAVNRRRGDSAANNLFQM
jgi:hypothetical protein